MRIAMPGWVGRLWDDKLTGRLVIGLVVLALLAGAMWGVYATVLDTSCGEGVERRGDTEECTGVTDGSVVFSPELRKVSARIKKENARVEEAEKPYVTVGFMIPMISGDPAKQRQIVEEVQGAHLAQYRANHRSNERTPYMRLVLANPGRGYAHWEAVSDQLIAASSGEHRLRAVAGFNVSVPSTEKALRHLTEADVPVVGGPITADDLTNDAAQPYRFPGLARVAPTNSDQAAALASVHDAEESSRSMVVEDLRKNDNYIATLRSAFEKITEDGPLAPEPYRSPPDIDDEGNLSNVFRQMVTSICSSKVDKIYFAGRPTQLRQYLNELGRRSCIDRHFTVVSGSHASTITVDEKLDWEGLRRGAGITMRYSSLAHPEAWIRDDAPATGGSAEAFGELAGAMEECCASGEIGELTLRDSRTIIAYDSVLTAVTGIRTSTVGDVQVPTLTEVADAWLRLHGPNRVAGASGWICLDRFGGAHNKAVHVVHLDPETRSAVFDSIAWPKDAPPSRTCSVPNPQ